MDTQNCTIQITAVESTEKKIVLKDGNLKYYFWLKKKDGTDTKANQQFQKFRFATGDAVEAAVKVEQKTFTNEKGKEINFTDRNIAFFLVQDNAPVAPQRPQEAVQAPITPKVDTELEKRLKALEERILKLELGDEYFPQATDNPADTISADEIPF